MTTTLTPPGLPMQSVLLAQRGFQHLRALPEKLAEVTIQPVIFSMLFGYLFGTAIFLDGGGSYHEFLISGLFAQTVIFASASMAAGVASDMQEGVIDRFRSLPIARSSVLIGRTVAELAKNMLGVAVTALTGLCIGWRIHTDLGRSLVAVLLLVTFGFAMSWVGVWIGMLVRTPDAAQGLFFITLFPITFASGIFVPTTGMTPWLRHFAEWNPASVLATAIRRLLGNPIASTNGAWPVEHAGLLALLWAIGITAVFGTISIRMYANRVST